MGALPAFVKTEKQRQAMDLMIKHTVVLLEGGSRSGKTFISVYAIIARAVKYENTNHLIVRKHLAHIKSSIWDQTLPGVLKIAFPNTTVEYNKSDLIVTFQNGSKIILAGTDDKERIEKLLGSEYATIYMNEASQMPYSTYEVLTTRLNPPRGIKSLFLIDFNPPSMRHWGYVLFHLLQNPETFQAVKNKERYAYIKMNPADNQQNLSSGYIETLEGMSEAKRRRFLLGEFGDDAEGALWRREWIGKNRVQNPPEKMARVVVAVDPAVTGTEKSDDTGIITVGIIVKGNDRHYYVLSDDTFSGGVVGWGQEVCRVFMATKADKVIAEVNQGGDLVEQNIRNYNRQIPYESVRATRGKAVRAEPVADLYRRGFVHHVGDFLELEDELCTWSALANQPSPNRLDALVWAVAYLAGGFSQVQAVQAFY
jgi:phage terminase large subunit-like protein